VAISAADGMALVLVALGAEDADRALTVDALLELLALFDVGNGMPDCSYFWKYCSALVYVSLPHPFCGPFCTMKR
jgi:hypothetical protein